MVALVFKHFLLISITNNMKNSTCREYNLLAGKRESFLSVFVYSTDLLEQCSLPAGILQKRNSLINDGTLKDVESNVEGGFATSSPGSSLSCSMGRERGLGMKLGEFVAT